MDVRLLALQGAQHSRGVVILLLCRGAIVKEPLQALHLMLLVRNLRAQGCDLCGDVGRRGPGRLLLAQYLFLLEYQYSSVDGGYLLSLDDGVTLVDVEPENLARGFGGDCHGGGFEDAGGVVVGCGVARGQEGCQSDGCGDIYVFHRFRVFLSL